MTTSYRWAALTLPFALGACDGQPLEEAGDDPDSPTAGIEQVIELFSWWTTPDEYSALTALLEVHTGRHPEAKVINAAVDGGGGDNARATLTHRMDEGRFPDTFQSNYGLALFDWIDFDPNGSTMESLDDLATEQGWFDVIPREILDVTSRDGHLYAVPVNVHRLNALYYNVSIFEDRGLEPPETWEDLMEVSDALANGEDPVPPFAIGGLNPWTVCHLAMNNILPAVGGADYYLDFFNGEADPRDPEILETWEHMLDIWRYRSMDSDRLEWDQAVGLVNNGLAAMTIMGDWTHGNLKWRGAEVGQDFGELPMPGTQDYYVFGGDCFPLLSGAPNRPATLDLLRTFGSAAGQDAFNPLKGSIPSRTDANHDLYDAAGQQKLQDFQNQQLIPSAPILAPPDFLNAVREAIPQYLHDEDPEIVIQAMADAYSLL
jgi:glucose/mannose transport system substrate-binding protein